MIVGVEIAGHAERVRGADFDVAVRVDAVRSECPHRLAIAVEANDVPTAALRREAPGLEGTDLAAVPELDDRVMAERVEQGRQRRRDRQ